MRDESADEGHKGGVEGIAKPQVRKVELPTKNHPADSSMSRLGPASVVLVDYLTRSAKPMLLPN